MIKYYAIIKDSVGSSVAMINDFYTLNYQLRVDGQIGAFSMQVSTKYIALFNVNKKDYRVQIWRSINNMTPVLDGKTEFLITKWEITRDYIIVVGNSVQELLSRRIIAYPANQSTYSVWTGNAGDIMKRIVRTNFTSAILASRDGNDAYADISAYLSVAGDYGDGVLMTKSASRQNVLDVINDIASTSYEQGTWIAGIITSNGSTFLFDTYTTFGIVRTLPMSELIGNIDNVVLTYDLSGQKSFVVAAGQGVEQARVIATAFAETRATASVLNRIETFIENGQISNVNALTTLARQELQYARGIQYIQCNLTITPTFIRGIHYNIGDTLIINFNNQQFTMRLDVVEISIQNNVLQERASFRI